MTNPTKRTVFMAGPLLGAGVVLGAVFGGSLSPVSSEPTPASTRAADDGSGRPSDRPDGERRGDHAGGTVASVDGSSFTVTRPDNTTVQVTTSSATTYMKTTDATVADAAPGTWVGAHGTRAADGTFTAEHIGIHPGAPPADRPAPRRDDGGDRHVAGQVVSNDGTKMTIRTAGGDQVVVTNSATKVTRTAAATFGDITTGSKVMAHGTPASDGSIAADKVHINASSFAGPGPGGPRDVGGRGRGGPPPA